MIPNTSILEFPILKRTRRYGAKVKSGCQTCKTRRIKCDEGKPECTRCVSTGRKCDGYTPTSSAQTLISSQSSSLAGTIPTLSGHGDGVLYLEFYYHRASFTLASNFDREFWSRIVLQMAHTEPAIRHAVIALGCLVKTQSGSLTTTQVVSMSDRTFLVQYNKAVRHLVDRMADPLCAIEVGLVACLLFICIEFLRGDYRSALTHLQSGIKILADYRQKSSICSRSSSPSSLFSIASREKVVGSRTVSENLTPMFVRAMGTGLMFGAPFEPLLENFCPRPQDARSRPFRTLLEAQSMMYELRNASIILISVLFRKFSTNTQPTDEDLIYHRYLLICHESWLQNLQNLERGKDLKMEDNIEASSLKVSHYSTRIALAGAIDICQSVFDAYLHDFKALNHHAKVVLDSMVLLNSSQLSAFPEAGSSFTSKSGNKKSSTLFPNRVGSTGAHFTFESSVIFPLYFAATRCRCPITRRTSVSLLERNPPREGPMDAKQNAMVARRVIEIEESEVDGGTGWPLQSTRLVSPTFDATVDKSGGFWASFTSVAWIMRGRDPLDPLRRFGDRISQHPFGEWEERFVI